MDDLLNNAVEPDVTATPETISTEDSEFSQESIPTDEPAQNVECEKKIKRRAKAAKVLGITALSITALKVLLCPILAIAALIFDVLAYFLFMLGGALALAMSIVAYPYVLPIAIIVILIVLAVIILPELIPTVLGIVATILASSAKKIARSHEIDCPKCKRTTTGAKRLSLIGLIVSIAAEPVAAIPAVLISLPFWILLLLPVIWLITVLLLV